VLYIHDLIILVLAAVLITTKSCWYVMKRYKYIVICVCTYTSGCDSKICIVKNAFTWLLLNVNWTTINMLSFFLQLYYKSHSQLEWNLLKVTPVKIFFCLWSQDKQVPKFIHLIFITCCPLNASQHKKISHLRGIIWNNLPPVCILSFSKIVFKLHYKFM
jgi:hypothetical protein